MYAQSLSHVQLSETLWTVVHRLSVHGILQAKILEWVAISYSSQGGTSVSSVQFSHSVVSDSAIP